MDIKEIALKIWPEVCKSSSVGEGMAVKFAEALLAELSKDAEPECPYPCGWKNLHSIIISRGAYLTRAIDPDEVGDEPWKAIMDVVLYARSLCEHGMKAPPVEAIEQRVVEACAAYVDRFIGGDGILNDVWISDIAEAIRRGEWRRFVK